MSKRIARIAYLLFLIASLVNCAKVGFAKGEAESSSVSSNGDGTVTGTLTGQGTPPSAPMVTPVSNLPKLQFLAGPCPHGALCAIEFRLDRPYALATDLDWHTNDTLYLTPHDPLYAQPGVQYLVTSGHVTFQPGEVSKVVFVQNINPYPTEVIIGVLISACAYGSAKQDCVGFFPNL